MSTIGDLTIWEKNAVMEIEFFIIHYKYHVFFCSGAYKTINRIRLPIWANHIFCLKFFDSVICLYTVYTITFIRVYRRFCN